VLTNRCISLSRPGTKTNANANAIANAIANTNSTAGDYLYRKADGLLSQSIIAGKRLERLSFKGSGDGRRHGRYKTK
jgi:hypothetical protein